MIRVHLQKCLLSPDYERQRFLTFLEATLNTARYSNHFVACFSQASDQLSQWRAYARDRSGFSIGFVSEELKAAMKNQPVKLVPCIYTPEAQTAIVAEMCEDIVSEFLACKKMDLLTNSAAGTLIRRLMEVAPILKDPSFSEEQEWRLVNDAHPGRIYFRAGSSMLLPYVKFSLAESEQPLKFKEVVVGPTPHMQLSLISASQLVSMPSVWCHQIRPSQVPYRSW